MGHLGRRIARATWLLADLPEYWLRAWRARARGRTVTPAAVPLRETPQRVSTDTAIPAFDCVAAPDASIVVPVFNQLQHTRRCLLAVAAAPGNRSFEVVVVDDGSTDDTARWLAGCVNVRVRRMPANAGFIAACNAGAAAARGKHLVFLNNDTEVQQGWLDALLDTFDIIPDCGLVGAKLIGADGRLQEAGGSVFRDGRALNVGRGADPADPRYNYVREVDYCSGACIAVPAELFRRLGGFDARYAPAYYEDTDLAFAVRAAGLRVEYQPRAEVVHAEGATAGTDLATGVKRYQVRNRERFVAKWQHALASQPTASDFARAPARCVTHQRAPRVLVVATDYPRPERDSGSVRMAAILRLLRELGCHVQFWALDAATRDAHARALENRGIEVVLAADPMQRLGWWYANGSEVDVAWLSRLPAAERTLRLARHYARRAQTVFDTVDLHFLRYERGAALERDAAARALARRFRRTELGLVDKSDTTLVVSPYERTLLGELVPHADVRVLSNIQRASVSQTPFAERSGLLFLGNFEHAPNVDAADWLIREIMPRLREALPNAVLHIAGYASDKAMVGLDSDNVVVHGFVPDLAPLLAQVRVALAPLRYGAGVKGKINLAMGHGLPVVTTPIGAEGMGLRNDVDALIEQDAGVFATAIARLYRDDVLWSRLSQNGLDSIRRHFSSDLARTTLQQLLRRETTTSWDQA